jgi:hypothetical protein
MTGRSTTKISSFFPFCRFSRKREAITLLWTRETGSICKPESEPLDLIANTISNLGVVVGYPMPIIWLPVDVVETGTTLLNQQIWCWGCDVKHPEGNLMLRCGFERRRPPRGIMGCSQYQLKMKRHRMIRLWGWGVLYCREGEGLFIQRYLFMPQTVNAAGLAQRIWMPQQIAPRMPRDSTERAAASSRLAELCDWIDGYERWVRKACGLHYRIDCLVRWNKPIAASANQMASRWRDVKKRVTSATTV